MSEEGNRVEAFFAGIGRRLTPALHVFAGAVLLLVIAEVLAFAALTIAERIAGNRTPDQPPEDPRQFLDVYEDAEWAGDYYREFEEANRTVYRPYTEYRRPPFSGRYINVDSAGLRRTVPDCGASHADPVRIFFMGGSAAWGTGARDEETIPSHLARKLCDRGIPATVTNFGESGYTNTQDMIQLQLELREGRVPDVVIFYDGVNDVYSSYQNRMPGLPQNVATRMAARRMDQAPAPTRRLINLVLQTNSGELARRVLSGVLATGVGEEARGWTAPEGTEAQRLDRATVETMLGNVRVVRALGEGYGFRSYFYWQPAIYNKRAQSPTEAELPRDSAFGAMYLRVTELIRQQDTISDLSDVFGDHARTVFIDEFHLAEWANELVADSILADVIGHIRDLAPAPEEEHTSQ